MAYSNPYWFVPSFAIMVRANANPEENSNLCQVIGVTLLVRS
jgi:hypothetical protein